jgi:hypothetical protein
MILGGARLHHHPNGDAILGKKHDHERIVTEALRDGVQRMIQPAVPETPFRTEPVDLGKCYFPNLDKTWEALDEAE